MTTPVGPVWLPSRDRTLPLFDYATPSPRGRQATPLPRRWPRMAQGNVLDFTLDATAWCAATGDPIASAAAVAAPYDLLVLACRVIGNLVVVWLTGGTPGVDHVVTVTIATAAGQQVDAEVALWIDACAPALSPVIEDLGTDAGVVITTDSGVPIEITTGELHAGTITTRNGVVLSTQSGIPLILSP